MINHSIKSLTVTHCQFETGIRARDVARSIKQRLLVLISFCTFEAFVFALTGRKLVPMGYERRGSIHRAQTHTCAYFTGVHMPTYFHPTDEFQLISFHINLNSD